ncbi:MAG: hypothetical protein O2960_28475 [Verrucomicrobia bacterium]|nr:hypothetical protein [Verrucomicrobiota bacterium]
MKDTTKDMVALELVVLATVIVTAIVLHFLLRTAFGVYFSIAALTFGLYLLRWIGWGFQHCRSQPHLHLAFAKILFVTEFGVGLGGITLLVAGIFYGSIILSVLGLAVIIGTASLDNWRRNFLTKEDVHEERIEGVAH